MVEDARLNLKLSAWHKTWAVTHLLFHNGNEKEKANVFPPHLLWDKGVWRATQVMRHAIAKNPKPQGPV